MLVSLVLLAVVTPCLASVEPTPLAVASDSQLYGEEPWFPLKGLLLECFPSLSWPCAQRKMVVYADQLNRARKVRVLGELLTLVKVQPDTTPPITEALLYARQIQDQDSLSRLMELVADRFVDSHTLRLSLPAVEGGRLVLTPLDISFSDSNSTEVEVYREGRDDSGKGGKRKGGKKKSKGGKKMMKMMMAMGKKAVEMVGKMMMMKMMMVVPIAMKKSMIGGMAGLMSMGLMKFMLIQKLISLLKKKLASCSGGSSSSSSTGYGGSDSGGCGGSSDDCSCGSGGSGSGWDRNYVYPYNYNHANNQPYPYYFMRQEHPNNDWSIWK